MTRARVLMALLGSVSLAAGCAQSPAMVAHGPFSPAMRAVQQQMGNRQGNQQMGNMPSNQQQGTISPREETREAGPARMNEREAGPGQNQAEENRVGEQNQVGQENQMGGRRVGPPSEGPGRRVGPPSGQIGAPGRRIGPPSEDIGRRVGPPSVGRFGRPGRRIFRPNWWGQRRWRGLGARPFWWGRTPFVSNSYVYLSGYYFPYTTYQGYVYPDLTSPYIYANGYYFPYYEQEPELNVQGPLPIGSAQIVTVPSNEIMESPDIE